MMAVLKVVDYRNDNAITIPVNLIQNTEKESFVFVGVEEGGKKVARKKVVTVGMVYNGSAEIISGLSTNDKLITTGASDLADGLEIKF
jgi:multidrug efflux pump subunit AcrA (membrane-fusion protein)